VTSIMEGSAYALHGLLGLLAWNWFFADATGLPHGTIMQALVVTLFLSALHPPEGTVEARQDRAAQRIGASVAAGVALTAMAWVGGQL